MKSADLLLHGGGFGVVLLDLSEINQKSLAQMPVSYWYLLKRVVQNTTTISVVYGNPPQAKAASRDSILC